MSEYAPFHWNSFISPWNFVVLNVGVATTACSVLFPCHILTVLSFRLSHSLLLGNNPFPPVSLTQVSPPPSSPASHQLSSHSVYIPAQSHCSSARLSSTFCLDFQRSVPCLFYVLDCVSAACPSSDLFACSLFACFGPGLTLACLK